MPTRVAAITLAKPAATGGRASQSQSVVNGIACATREPLRRAAGAAPRAAARAFSRIASLTPLGGSALGIGRVAQRFAQPGVALGVVHRSPPPRTGSRYAPMHVRSLLIA